MNNHPGARRLADPSVGSSSGDFHRAALFAFSPPSAHALAKTGHAHLHSPGAAGAERAAAVLFLIARATIARAGFC